jgi:hypothetical protein
MQMTDKQQFENKEEAVEMTIEEFLAIRKEAGLKIDPETAEVDWNYAEVLDPYGIHQAWRKLLNKPDTITSIGMRDWAHIGQSK